MPLNPDPAQLPSCAASSGRRQGERHSTKRPGAHGLLLLLTSALAIGLSGGACHAQTPHTLDMHALAQPPTRTLHVLGIAIDRYQDPAIPSLPQAEATLQILLKALEQQRGRVYAEVKSQSLLGEAATTAAMRGQLQTFCAQARPEDACILLLYTHAWRDRAAASPLLLGVDSQLKTLSGGTDSDDADPDLAISQGSLLEAVLSQSADQPRPPLLILAETGDRTELEPVELIWPEAPPPSLAQLTVGAGPQPTAEQSAFSKALLQALTTQQADRNRDGLVSLLELETYVSQQVKTESGGSQLPELSGALPRDRLVLWAPGTTEHCNGVDDDGDGQIDEDFDLDRDGFRSGALCAPRFGSDCDDQNALLHPAQPDPGNFLDDDCDGVLDEDDPDGDEWQQLIASDEFYSQLTILLHKLRIAERNLQQSSGAIPDFYLGSA